METRLLEGSVTLDYLLKIARAQDAVSRQLRKTEQNSNQGHVNAIGEKNSGGAWNACGARKVGGARNARGAKRGKKPKTCFGCGWEGHFAGDKSCPARDQARRRCGKIDHFLIKCTQSPLGGARMFKGGKSGDGKGTLDIPARGAGVIPNALLFTKAWASAFEDDGPGLELVGTTTEGAREADPVAWSLDTALDVSSIGARRVAIAKGLVTGAVDDILALGMLARRCIMTSTNRSPMALMMPGETSWLERPAARAELGGSAVWADGPTAITEVDGWTKGGCPAR